MISTPEIKLKPRQSPSNPPICDMYWIKVILSSLVYSNRVGDSKKKVTIAMSFSYASYFKSFSSDAENTTFPLTFSPRARQKCFYYLQFNQEYKSMTYLCNL